VVEKNLGSKLAEIKENHEIELFAMLMERYDKEGDRYSVQGSSQSGKPGKKNIKEIDE